MALDLTLHKKKEESSENLIILIHGLGATETTWNQDEVSWIDLFLTDNTYKSIDIGEVTYDTSHLANGILFGMGLKKIKISSFRNFNVGKGPSTSIEILARELKREIDSNSIRQYKNVILLGHSMGGLIAVRYILEEIEHDQSHNIKGVISLATPYNGSSFALYNQLIKSINKQAQIPSLEPNSSFLDETMRLWQKHLYELTTDFKFFFGTEDNVVPENSAIPLVANSKWKKGIPLPGNHNSILKVKDHSSTNYIHVSEAVKLIIEKDIMLKKKLVDDQRKLILAKCITRLKANGLNREQAINLLENTNYNFEYLKPTMEKRLVVVVGEFGIGKSFAVDRINLDLLLRAEEELDFPLPIYLNAAQLNRNIQNYLEEIVLDKYQEYWITVDGMDEVPLSLSANILENMRIATERWSNVRVILTSRPLTIFNKITEKVYINGLSEIESLELVKIINTGQEIYHYYNFTKDIREVIRRPLFAILLGLYLRDKTDFLPTTSGELLAFLIESALDKVEITESNTKRLLMNLGMVSTSRGNVPVRKSEIGDFDEIRSLLNSGIVIEEDGYISFVLPILNQWFAAKSLAENLIDINEIIDDKILDYWKYSLVILITLYKEGKIDNILREIVVKDPGFAAILIEESIKKWGIHKEITELSIDQCAYRIRMAMNYWVKSLGSLSDSIAPVDLEQNVLPLGVKKEKQWLSTSWYRGEERLAEINVVKEKGFDQKWLQWRGARPGNGSSWYWRWTLEDLKDNLTKKISNKSLPICTNIIYEELMWSITLKIAMKGSLYTSGIAIKDIKSKLEVEYQDVHHIKVENNLILLSIYKNYIENLERRNIHVIESPLLGADIKNPKDNWVWSKYSDERLYKRTLQIYREVIMGYREVVETFFPYLKNRMSKYVLYPFIFKGKFKIPEKYGTRSIGPGLEWYLEPLPYDKNFVLDIEMTNRDAGMFDDDIFNKIDTRIKESRPEAAIWLNATQIGQELDIFGTTPVTDIIYEWLKSDLKSINWIK